MKQKHKLPGYLLEKNQLLGTVTFTVLFALIFLNIYIPFSETAWFRLGNSQMFLFTAGFAFISILILIVSRIVMYKVSRFMDFSYLGYVLWCVLEVLLICAFYTFVTVDVVDSAQNIPVYRIFLRSLLYGTVSLIIPYILAGMYFTIIDKNRTIRMMRYSDAQDRQAEEGHEAKISLFDNNGALKLSVMTSSLYYIESDDNYVKVWYMDASGQVKTYMLRCRLKAVERSFKGTPLVRCHRKYMVNLDKVRVLRKERDVYIIDMDNDSIQPLPVSRTYADDVLSYFMKDSPGKVSEAQNQ